MEKIYAGINYIRADGTSRASEFAKAWEAEHPEATRFYGDFRSVGKNVKKIVLMTYEYDMLNRSSKWKSAYRKYIVV